jgi:hypothetical protein
MTDSSASARWTSLCGSRSMTMVHLQVVSISLVFGV